MKLLSILLIVVCHQTSHAALSMRWNTPEQPGPPPPPTPEQRKFTLDMFERSFIPKDPLRVINGVTNGVKGEGWCHFSGLVLEVQPDGLRLKGSYSSRTDPDDAFFGEFFVSHYPYQAADDSYLGADLKLVAKEASVYTYRTVAGGSHSIRRLDYGEPWIAPPPAPPKPLTPEQLEAAKSAAEKKKTQMQAAAFKHYESLAAKGDAFGQWRLGHLYAIGEGCAKDLPKARALLAMASSQGQTEAAAELSALEVK